MLCCLQIMKDMERWAKIQNRQKESVRAASPVLKGGMDDDRRQSKSADAGFAIFERKVGIRLRPNIILYIFFAFTVNVYPIKNIYIIYIYPVFFLRFQGQMNFLRSLLLLLRRMKSQRYESSKWSMVSNLVLYIIPFVCALYRAISKMKCNGLRSIFLHN